MIWLLMNTWWLLPALAALGAGIAIALGVGVPVLRELVKRTPALVWQGLAAVLAVSLASSWLIGHGRSEGRAEVQAKWDAAVAAQQAEADRQQEAADEAAKDAIQAGQEAVATTREETGHAAETVRTIIRDRIVEVPAACRAAVVLPDSVQAQGREAVARARGAVPAAPDGRNP